MLKLFRERMLKNSDESKSADEIISSNSTRENEEESTALEKLNRQSSHKLWITLLAIFLRLFALHFFTDFFEQLPLFSTPWSSMKRFKEGVFLLESGHNPYEGDLFHVLPMFVHALRPSLANQIILRLEWTFLDLLSAYFLSEFVDEYIRVRSANLDKSSLLLARAKWLSSLAFAGYLLNPMSIGCWVVSNLSAIINALVSASLLFMIRGNLLPSIFTLALAIQMNPYYAALFAPIFIRFADRKVFVLFLSALLSISLFAINFVLEGNRQALWRSTIGFFLNVPDLTPNNGIFWYFFTQVFEHFRLLFLCVFQLNTLIFVVPLSAMMRKNPALLGSLLLMMVSLFSPYPSYAETAIYLPTLCAFFDLHKYLRQRLVTGCAVLATVVLSPVMWAMWVTIGSGNANFFFAIVWVFSLAQIFISADLISSYLRAELIKDCIKTLGLNEQETEKMEERFEGVRLFSISPF